MFLLCSFFHLPRLTCQTGAHIMDSVYHDTDRKGMNFLCLRQICIKTVSWFRYKSDSSLFICEKVIDYIGRLDYYSISQSEFICRAFAAAEWR